MSERDPMIERAFDGDVEPMRLHETLAHWVEAREEEELSEEEQLANFLETLSKSDRPFHAGLVNGAFNPTGRRSAARLRISLPARLISIEETHRAILLNISRSGAQIAIINALREGEGGMLECGSLKAFGVVTRSEFSINALHFEEPISQEAVLEMRRYYETFEERERRKLIETARRWVNGSTRDERAI